MEENNYQEKFSAETRQKTGVAVFATDQMVQTLSDKDQSENSFGMGVF